MEGVIFSHLHHQYRKIRNMIRNYRPVVTDGRASRLTETFDNDLGIDQGNEKTNSAAKSQY